MKVSIAQKLEDERACFGFARLAVSRISDDLADAAGICCAAMRARQRGQLGVIRVDSAMPVHRQLIIQHRKRQAKKADMGNILVIRPRIKVEFFRPQLLR